MDTMSEALALVSDMSELSSEITDRMRRQELPNAHDELFKEILERVETSIAEFRMASEAT